MPTFTETLYLAYGQAFRIDERLHEVTRPTISTGSLFTTPAADA